MKRGILVLILACLLEGAAAPLRAAPALPAPGEWDGVTASAHLETPYEDSAQSHIPFPTLSYYMQPWRSYMDTWSAAQWEGCPGANVNMDPKYADAIGQVLKDSGIRTVRIELSWGSLDWNDQVTDWIGKRNYEPIFQMCRKYGIRPMILLNGNCGLPCPTKAFFVNLVADANAGDTVLKLAPGTKVHEGYTGPSDSRYIAAFPLILKVDADGTAHLSAALHDSFKAGQLRLVELKYQPFQGDHLADGTPVPACQETFDGWVKYVAAVARYATDELGTAGRPDAGFDLEVWNELGFGSNFLDIANYYDVAPKYKTYKYDWGYLHTKTRPLLSTYRPDAQTQFQAANALAILPMTVDYIQDHQDEYPGVKVVDGFSNQDPFEDGTDLWPGQAGISRHYYTGGYNEVSQKHPLNRYNSTTYIGTINALGHFEGKPDGSQWCTVIPGSTFVPTVNLGYPELFHSGFHSESLSRDVLPDSRYVYFQGHGRYTNNGDFRPAELWQTEVNFDRSGLFKDEIFKDGSIKRDDPRALALDEHLAAKNMLRQYLFHNHKGLKRIYMFALGADPYADGMFPARFYAALDASKYALTPAVRATIPEGFAGLAWLTKQMDGGQVIDAPRPLKVNDVVEYKPRLVSAGDGTAAHPNTWNRDWFTFLPYQLAPNKFLIPYYVQTTDLWHVWDKTKGLLDPARWDMPAQDYDVTIGNIRGIGATVSVFDPITLKAVPASVVNASANSLTVHLSTVDYPRLLTITESHPGPEILGPKLELTADNHVRVSWQTNIPASISITYGADWENRSAQQADLAAGATTYTIPAVINGVVAVRIKAVANGLRDIWPHWDEDPQGQIVAPIPSPALRADPSRSGKGEDAPVFAAPAPVPVITLARGPLPILAGHYADSLAGWSVRLPAGVTASVNGSTMEAALSGANGVVILRARYLPDGAASASNQLPYASSIDAASSIPVTLPAGMAGTFYEYTLAAAANPGMTNLSQLFLLVPAGESRKDLLVLSASGAAEAMAACRNVILAVAGSVIVPGPGPAS